MNWLALVSLHILSLFCPYQTSLFDNFQELFYLLGENEVDVPLGKIAAKMLNVELAAGGVSEEHADYVSKYQSYQQGRQRPRGDGQYGESIK